MLSGLWGLPMLETSGQAGDTQLAHLLRSLGLRTKPGPAVAQVRHSITNQRIRLDVHLARTRARHTTPRGCRWLSAEQLDGVGLASLYSKALRAVGML